MKWVDGVWKWWVGGVAGLNGGAPTHERVAANFWSEAIKTATVL